MSLVAKRILGDTGLSQQLKARFYALIYKFKGERSRFSADGAHAAAVNLIDTAERGGQRGNLHSLEEGEEAACRKL